MTPKMSKNSLFAILLRSPWWISALVALVLPVLSLALLPADLRAVGVLSGLPFIVVAVIAARRQWRLPSAERVARTQQAVAAMAWPAFASLLEQAFRRDGYSVAPGRVDGVDFELERQGRRKLVCARRWKSARTGLEPLRALQAARAAADASDALYIGLGSVSDNAQPYADTHGIEIWRAGELAQALRGLPLAAPQRR